MELSEYFASGCQHPFSGFWDDTLDGVLREEKPREVMISVSYLSQLPAAVDLHRYLTERGFSPLVGGSLANSLFMTGTGFDLLESVFPGVRTGDGSELMDTEEPALSGLAWPRMLSGWDYLCRRPVIPFSLSTGCFWNRCLFCPDRSTDFYRVPLESLTGIAGEIPSSLPGGRPLFHFLDSAIPPAALAGAANVVNGIDGSFYGFVRPTGDLLEETVLDDLSRDGCLMLQMGVESGSRELMDRFDKGLDPLISLDVMEGVAAAGIRTYIYMLLGLPGETAGDHEETAALLERAGDSLDFLNVSVFNLPRNSELAGRAAEFGMRITDFDAPDHAIRLYSPFTCSGGSPREEARIFIRRHLSAIAAVERALKNTPRWFRGPHMALMDIPGRTSPV
jgi:hypothetical protein